MAQAQAQHTQTRTHMNPLLAAALGALVMAAVLTGALIISGQVALPSFGQATTTATGVSEAVLNSGQEWEAQRRQQAGVGVLTADELDMGILWEETQRQQTGTAATQANDSATRPTVR